MPGNTAPSLEIVPLPQVVSILSAADSLRKLLDHEDNADIKLELPGGVERYTGALVDVFRNLNAEKKGCTSGRHEQFVAFLGNAAVGMAMASIESPKPAELSPGCANVSLFVCRPYRKEGIGSSLLKACLLSVDMNFSGHAWTAIRPDNKTSERLVTTAGFRPAGDWEGRSLFHYITGLQQT